MKQTVIDEDGWTRYGMFKIGRYEQNYTGPLA